MTPGEVDKRIERLDGCIDEYVGLIESRVLTLEATAESDVRCLRITSENRIGEIEVRLVPYINSLYLSAEYHLTCALFYASPGLFAILAAVWGVIVFVYETVKWIIDILHIKELLVIADILSVIWPAFRTRMNKIYGKISEFSAQIGWGADGVMHLLQATQQGISTLGGFLGKDDSWLEIKGADRAIDAMRRLSDNAYAIERDPGGVLDIIFKAESRWTKFEISEFWQGVSLTIERAADNAINAIGKVNGAITALQDLRNTLPGFIRDNIPQQIWAGIEWVDMQIDDMILPALSRIDRTFNEVNAVLEAHRKKAESLVDQLTRPGDVLLGMDKLTEAGRLLEEDKIDDAASRKYERETDLYEEEDAGIIAEFARISEALEVPAPPPVFLAIEDMPPHMVPGIVLEDRETWFVGDF